MHYYDHLPVHEMNITNTRPTVDDLLMIDSDLNAPPLIPIGQNKLKDELDEVAVKVFFSFI